MQVHLKESFLRDLDALMREVASQHRIAVCHQESLQDLVLDRFEGLLANISRRQLEIEPKEHVIGALEKPIQQFVIELAYRLGIGEVPRGIDLVIELYSEIVRVLVSAERNTLTFGWGRLEYKPETGQVVVVSSDLSVLKIGEIDWEKAES